MDPDFILLRRMRLGDDTAIEQFVRKYYPLLLRYCGLRMHSTGDAEDAVQETFERFFRSFEQYRHYGKAANYLYVIAGNICKDHYRKRAELPMAELPEGADSTMEQLDQQLTVRAAVYGLPEDLRETALLFFFQGRKQKEIAKILKIGLPLVKYRIKRAKEILAETLREEDMQNVR